jgi:GDPmannose 4,6-dehydratase
MMNALIFGAGGQDGFYLQQLCRELGIDAIGISRSPGSDYIQGDVSEYDQVKGLVNYYHPTYIFHLAANSTTRHSALFENHATISIGTINILECVKNQSPDTKVFIAGSGVQFKNTGQPIAEKDEFEASSVYSVARIHSVYAARYYRSLGIRAYVGYLFHHESPRRKSGHIAKMISLAAQHSSAEGAEKIKLGDISVRKEWAFAGDIVRGILTLVNQDDVFEAAIGTGDAFSIEDWLEQCFGLVGKDWREHVDLCQGFTPEYHCLVSNPKTIQSLGWVPAVGFSELASMMMAGT